MARKTFTLDDGSTVAIYKRRASRSLRLSIAANGEVRVSIPAWAPYRAGLEFARSKQAWILSQAKVPQLLQHGQPVGKAHHLAFVPSGKIDKPTSRLADSAVIVKYPFRSSPEAADVQAAAQEACVRALRNQAERLLPQRLQALADKHDFGFKSVKVKRLKGRWGSCDQDQNIVLNLFLMQLPWELIDYVLLHELTHTTILRHGPDFWTAMETVLPDAKHLRTKMRDHQPILV